MATFDYNKFIQDGGSAQDARAFLQQKGDSAALQALPPDSGSGGSTYGMDMSNPYLKAIFTEQTQQPLAQLGQTQASTGLTNTEQQKEQYSVNQQNALLQAGKILSASKSKQYGGFVAPDVYNKIKAGVVSTGVPADNFDNQYAQSYVSPNSVLYDTPDAKAARGALPVIKQAFDSYQKIAKGQKGMPGMLQNAVDTGEGVLSQVPVLGQFLQQGPFAQQEAHNKLVMALSGQIRQAAGAGPSQGFRFNLQELNNIIGMLPNGYDTPKMADQKAQQLDSYAKSKLGLKNGFEDLIGGNF